MIIEIGCVLVLFRYVNFRGVRAGDSKRRGSHNWDTFEDYMKAKEDKANTLDDMNDSSVKANPKEATDASIPAAPTGPSSKM